MVWNIPRESTIHLAKAQTLREQNNIFLGEGGRFSVFPSKKWKRSRICLKTTGVFQGLLAGIVGLILLPVQVDCRTSSPQPFCRSV